MAKPKPRKSAQRRSTRAQAKRSRPKPRPRKTGRPSKVPKGTSKLSRGTKTKQSRPGKTRALGRVQRLPSRRNDAQRAQGTGRAQPRESGFGVKVAVTSRLHGGKEVTLNRKTTRFEPIKMNSKNKSKVTAAVTRAAERHFTKINGKSKKDLLYLKLEYTYKFKGKSQKSRFSIGVAKIKTKAQLNRIIERLVSSFESKLQGYSKGGFSNIEVSGMSLQGYE